MYTNEKAVKPLKAVISKLPQSAIHSFCGDPSIYNNYIEAKVNSLNNPLLLSNENRSFTSN